MCIEKLSHLIQADIVRWKPINSSQTSPFVSHLFFVDDLILFAEASTQQARVLKNCMGSFYYFSGHCLNFEKPKLYCPSNVCKKFANDISQICGSPLTNVLSKYLGMPLIHSRVSKGTYVEIIDKV